MKRNQIKNMFNQGYGIKFLAAALGLIFLCAFTVVAAPVIAGNSEGGQQTAAVTDVSSEPNAVISGEASSFPELVSYESGGLPAQATSHADSYASGPLEVVTQSPSYSDTVSYKDAVSYDWGSGVTSYGDTSYTDSGNWQATTSYGETFSAIVQPYLTCSKPKDQVQSKASDVVSRDPGGFIWMSDEQIRNEIDTIRLGRFYNLPITGKGIPFNFEMFYEIMGILRQYEWQDYTDYINVYELRGNQIEVVSGNTLYTYLTFVRDREGRPAVQSQYDNKIAYLTEEDYTHICDLLGHARQAD